jgi:hypothetical protein
MSSLGFLSIGDKSGQLFCMNLRDCAGQNFFVLFLTQSNQMVLSSIITSENLFKNLLNFGNTSVKSYRK